MIRAYVIRDNPLFLSLITDGGTGELEPSNNSSIRLAMRTSEFIVVLRMKQLVRDEGAQIVA